MTLSMPQRYNDIVKVEPLIKYYAAKLFLYLCHENGCLKGKTPEELMKHQLFEQPLTNVQILNIADLIKKHKTIDVVYNLIEK